VKLFEEEVPSEHRDRCHTMRGLDITANMSPAHLLFEHLIVCGVSNWGAYGLATGVRLLQAEPHDAELYDLERERELLRIMVDRGLLVDGASGEPTIMVDSLSFDTYAAPLRRMGELSAAIW
jgi:hypothetical protein